MLHEPWPIYFETQLAASGIAIMDNTVARRLRPSLFVGGSGETALYWDAVERARAAGTLYSATIRTTAPEEVGKIEITPIGGVRKKTADDRRTVLVIALSSNRLAERLRWLGLDVEGVAPWQEPEPEPARTPEEEAECETARAALRAELKMFPGHPPVQRRGWRAGGD